jgi:hypothetical protein
MQGKTKLYHNIHCRNKVIPIFTKFNEKHFFELHQIQKNIFGFQIFFISILKEFEPKT